MVLRSAPVVIATAAAVALGVGGLVLVQSLRSDSDEAAATVAQSASDGRQSPGQALEAPNGEDVVARVAGRGNIGKRISVYDDLTDLLRNVEYQRGEASAPICDLVIRGRVVRVEEGVGFANRRDANGGLAPTDSGIDTRKVEFGSSEADFVTAELTVQVTETLGSAEPAPTEVRVGFVMSSADDLEGFDRGLMNAESYVFFLERDNPVFRYDPSLHSVVRDGTLLTEVMKDGQLALPGLNDSEEEKFLNEVKMYEKLKEKSKEPKEVRKAPEIVGRK